MNLNCSDSAWQANAAPSIFNQRRKQLRTCMLVISAFRNRFLDLENLARGPTLSSNQAQCPPLRETRARIAIARVGIVGATRIDCDVEMVFQAHKLESNSESQGRFIKFFKVLTTPPISRFWGSFENYQRSLITFWLECPFCAALTINKLERQSMKLCLQVTLSESAAHLSNLYCPQSCSIYVYMQTNCV